MIIVSAVLLLSFGGFVYLYMEVNNFISAPRLVIIKPQDGSSVDGNSTHVTGVAEKDALVFINDQPVLVNENGEYGEDVGLRSGTNTITVKAKNKFDKEAVQSVTVNANFEDAQAQNFPEASENSQQVSGSSISAEIYVNPNPTWLSVEADGNLVYSGVLLPESVQTFEAKEVINITSGKGNETFVKINGKEMGTISNDPGVVRDIKYNSSGKIENNETQTSNNQAASNNKQSKL
jgi:hypothetical protein